MMSINKIFKYLASLAWLVTLMACSDSADRVGDDGYVRVVFQIYMPSSTVVTRASVDPASRTGDSAADSLDDWEYAIDKNRLHVVFYNKDGRAIGGVEQLVLLPTQKENEYKVTGSIKLDKLQMSNGGFTGKVMVYANIDGVDELSDFSQEYLNRLTFSYQNTIPHFIPMWGVKQLENIPFVAGQQYDIKTINLLRAEAKIKVTLRPDMVEQGYRLTQVNLLGHQKQGYCLPPFGSIANLEDANQLTDANIGHFHDANPSVEPIDMAQGDVYVPEYQNSGDGITAPAIIRLRLTDRFGKESDYQLKFVDYDASGAPTSQAIDILRNHYYQFQLYKGDNDILHVKLNVRKWYYTEHDHIIM